VFVYLDGAISEDLSCDEIHGKQVSS